LYLKGKRKKKEEERKKQKEKKELKMQNAKKEKDIIYKYIFTKETKSKKQKQNPISTSLFSQLNSPQNAELQSSLFLLFFFFILHSSPTIVFSFVFFCVCALCGALALDFVCLFVCLLLDTKTN
jgi:Flp pilus assembly protein TadB